jgi:hypothetical protein
VGNGTTQSTPAQAAIRVDNTLAIAPSAIRFSDIKLVLQTVGCTDCHSTTPLPAKPMPPVFYDSYDRDGVNGPVADATDDLWFYTELRGRINFTDPAASALLRKPSGQHHAGLLQPGFDTSFAVGNVARRNYDLFVNWISNNAPQ